MTKQATAGEIWQTLSAIDVSKHTQDKNGQSFLSWSWAWGVLMEHYPDAEYCFQESETMADGTVMIYCTVSIGNFGRQMWLPVMDYKNRAISNPNAFQINTAKMRCLVKCLGMLGLGHYIYAGEDLPSAERDKQAEAEANRAKELAESQKPLSAEQLEKINSLIEQTESDVAIFTNYFKIEKIADLTTSQADVALLKLETKLAEVSK